MIRAAAEDNHQSSKDDMDNKGINKSDKSNIRCEIELRTER